VKRKPEDNEVRLDEPAIGSRQIHRDSAGQSGDPQGLSDIEDSNEEGVEELAETDQAFEASVLDGVEDAADHPERPTHTHDEYGYPEDAPSRRKSA